ncbi:MAG: recombinase family protein [Chloroflexi bacterium]|nr:recombinase family protein [Chloroflexota bacterium]
MYLVRWSCLKISVELNSLGVPTAYARENRMITKGKRKVHTRGVWRAGRIRNLVVNPVYRGELQYGRRTIRPGGGEVISASVPALASDEVWHAAQRTLKLNRIIPKNTERVYLLRSVIRCGICGLNYTGVHQASRATTWYRCNGKALQRGKIEGKCPNKAFKGDQVEPLVWSDIERFLRNPGDILEELQREREMNDSTAAAEAERMSLEEALRQIAQERKTASS